VSLFLKQKSDKSAISENEHGFGRTYNFVFFRPGFPKSAPGCLPRLDPGFGPGIPRGLSGGGTGVASELTGEEPSLPGETCAVGGDEPLADLAFPIGV
jgi:hypothetical protein